MSVSISYTIIIQDSIHYVMIPLTGISSQASVRAAFETYLDFKEYEW